MLTIKFGPHDEEIWQVATTSPPLQSMFSGKELGQVTKVYADGPEYVYIKTTMKNVPYQIHSPFGVWFDSMARFITSNLVTGAVA
jgi:hypothetical protein